jgi:membrane protease YdiL (CAAX protease family)
LKKWPKAQNPKRKFINLIAFNPDFSLAFIRRVEYFFNCSLSIGCSKKFFLFGLNMKNLVALAGPAVAVAAYFIFGQPLWATIGLGVLTLFGFILPSWRAAMGLARVVFVFCLLMLIINELGIAYPYSNIFVLTGLIGLFFLSGESWKGLFFGPGQTRQWTGRAFFLGLGFAAVVLALFALLPKNLQSLGANPVPIHWPVDVLIVVGIGYALFSTLMEETIFRSVMVAFSRSHLTLPVAVVAQGVVFGAMHYRVGFPSNAGGAVLAFIWGLLAGWLVVKAESIYPAFVMHFVVVLTLFVGLIFLQ